MTIWNSGLALQYRLLSFDRRGYFSRTQFVLTQRFDEYLFQFFYRYCLLLESEKALCDGIVEPQNHKHQIQELQIAFVNDLESFFEQHSKVLSTFAELLIGTTDQRLVPKNIIKNHGKLFDFLKAVTPRNAEKIKLLKQANDFRNDIVHFHEQIKDDWMTASYSTSTGQHCSVVYYKPLGPEVYFQPVTNPYDKHFIPPVRCSSYFINPQHEIIYKETLTVLTETLQMLAGHGKEGRLEASDGVEIKTGDFLDARFGELKERLFIHSGSTLERRTRTQFLSGKIHEAVRLILNKISRCASNI